MNTLGDLERALLEHLWAVGGPVSATRLREEFADRGLALTTVHTVLTRLEQKGFVAHDDARPRQFRAQRGRRNRCLGRPQPLHDGAFQLSERSHVPSCRASHSSIFYVS